MSPLVYGTLLGAGFLVAVILVVFGACAICRRLYPDEFIYTDYPRLYDHADTGDFDDPLVWTKADQFHLARWGIDSESVVSK